MLFVALCLLILLFGFVSLRGAPYLPTKKKQMHEALDLLNLKAGQTVLELGSGDGSFLVIAAKRGYKAVGYELNPLLVVVCKLRTWKYRSHVRVIWGDCWLASWPPSDGMFVFMMDKFMIKLDKKLIHYAKGKSYPVVSNSFQIVGKKHTKHLNGLYLYMYK